MKSIKAIVAGSVFILIAILLLQLIFIFVAVGYNALAKDFPLLHDIAGSFRYIVGIPLFIATMFIGGYITAAIAEMKTRVKVLIHCMIVGLLTTGSMIYPLLEYAELTTTGIVIFLLAITSTAASGLYWQKIQQKNLAST